MLLHTLCQSLWFGKPIFGHEKWYKMNALNEHLFSDRKDFEKGRLDDGQIPENPALLFAYWLKEAIERHNPEPYAFTLLTNSADGFPDGRIVYLRTLEDDGALVFFTNYNSQKARNIHKSNNVGAVFFWPNSERQVRVSGYASKVPKEFSDAYFASRPRESQIGAWTSEQSSELSSRSELEERFAEMSARFALGEIPRPPHWGGYAITPVKYEFWQGRPNRLHDRIVYRKENDAWLSTRLSP